MKINFLEIAQIELDDAIEYYNYEVSWSWRYVSDRSVECSGQDWRIS